MSFRSPLGRALDHGSAHDGVSHWIVARVTAVALAPLSIWLLAALLSLPRADYATVQTWIGAGLNPVWLALTVLLAAWHSWLGVQIVVEDYVHTALTKTLTLLLSTGVHALLALGGVYAVLRIALRGPV